MPVVNAHPVPCPNAGCGASNPPHARFCASCGRSLNPRSLRPRRASLFEAIGRAVCALVGMALAAFLIAKAMIAVTWWLGE